MKIYLSILSGMCLAGCMASNSLQYEAAAETNVYHIAKVRKGMSEKQVLQLMQKPYSYESFQVNDDIYDVWFYVTRATGLDQTRMVPQNLTPLTFKNGVLVGTGYQWYYYAMKEQSVAAVATPPEKPTKVAPQGIEDTEVEKTLQSTPVKPTQNKAPTPQQAPVQAPAKSGSSWRILYLSSVNQGMSEDQVIGCVGKPARKESYELNDDDYEIWFYDTIPSKSAASSSFPQLATPLIFKNSILISKSDDDYFDLREKLVAKANAKPQMGMTENEVSHLVGAPTKMETYYIDQDVYDVWFYTVGRANKMPLTFKNGVLSGMTLDYYNKIVAQSKESSVRGYTRQTEQMEEAESNQNFNFW